LILCGVCIVAPYAFGVRPRTSLDWTMIALTLAFLVWLLPMMESLLSW
jgi:hypothetical protein